MQFILSSKLSFRVRERSLSLDYGGLRLVDVFTAESGAKQLCTRIERDGIRPRLVSGHRQWADVQASELLPGPHEVTFVDVDGRNTTGDAKRERYGADIDVAVQDGRFRSR